MSLPIHRHLAAVALLAFAAVAAQAAEKELTAEERAAAIQQLEASQRTLTAAIANLSDAQWRFRPAEGKWSIADVVEHLVKTEAAIPQLLTQQIMRTPEQAAVDTSRDAKIRPMMLDRSHKAQAPESLKPAGQLPSQADATAAFTKLRVKTIDYLRTTTDDLRHHAAPHPAIGTLDGYQWLLFLAAHTERHTEQIDEVKASASYPGTAATAPATGTVPEP